VPLAVWAAVGVSICAGPAGVPRTALAITEGETKVLLDEPIAVVIAERIDRELWLETVTGSGRCLRLYPELFMRWA